MKTAPTFHVTTLGGLASGAYLSGKAHRSLKSATPAAEALAKRRSGVVIATADGVIQAEYVSL